MQGQPLFDKIVSLCGVSAVLAPGLVRRALLDGKVKVEDATAADYRVAMPRLLARLRAYMPEEEAQRRARRIAAVLAQLDAGKSIDGDDESEGTLAGRVAGALRGGTPAEGHSRHPSFASSEVAVDDPDEITLLGRRFTADELKRIAETGEAAGLDADRKKR